MERGESRITFIGSSVRSLLSRFRPTESEHGEMQHQPYPWEIELLRMEEEGIPSKDRKIFIYQSVSGRNSDKERIALLKRLHQVLVSEQGETLEEAARSGDPNAIMKFITKAGEDYIGNREAQRSAAGTYLKMGMSALKKKFLLLEAFAHEIGVDPYSDEDSGQARMTE